MPIKQRFLLIATGVLLVGGLLTGCQENEATPEVKPVVAQPEANENEQQERVEAIELADWTGTWNNMGAYLDDAELQAAFVELAEKEGISEAEAKEAYEARREAAFDGLIIEQDTVTLLDGFASEDGAVIAAAPYEYEATMTVKHGNFDTEWYHFTATEDTTYPVLLLMPVHGEELLTHFHVRYGDDLEALLANDDWYPTFISPNSTYDQIHGEITE